MISDVVKNCGGDDHVAANISSHTSSVTCVCARACVCMISFLTRNFGGCLQSLLPL